MLDGNDNIDKETNIPSAKIFIFFNFELLNFWQLIPY
jgi:hypothetical protein